MIPLKLNTLLDGRVVEQDRVETFRKGEAISRRYRNRRIGEFLKEIDLCEQKSTGITKIFEALAQNGSPPPKFETNEEGRDYLQTTIFIHGGFEFEDASNETQLIRDNGNVPNVPNNETHNDNVMDSKVGKEIISVIERNQSASYDYLAASIGVTRKRIQRYIQDLKKAGNLHREGGTRGYWEVAK